MKLEQLLAQKRSDILGKWQSLTLETYPADSQRFLKKQKDPFANPVGTTLSRDVENIYDGLLKEAEIEWVYPFLDRIIRIRAVQDFSPSQAVSIVLLLKKAIRLELEKELREHQLHEQLLAFDSRLDDVLLLAFDIYAKCKEKIYEIRVQEIRNHVSRLLQKSGLTCEIPSWNQGSIEDDSV